MVTELPHWATCWIHNASEVQTVNSYKVCGECWHVWQTEADFRADVEVLYRYLGTDGTAFVLEVPPLDEIYSCPFCVHDF